MLHRDIPSCILAKILFYIASMKTSEYNRNWCEESIFLSLICLTDYYKQVQ